LQNGKVVHIFRAAAAGPVRTVEPGEIALEGGQLLVGTGDGTVRILELQQEGRKRMGVEEFLRGARLQPGKKFV
jgi:methionyl-tRNA formyltransferase